MKIIEKILRTPPGFLRQRLVAMARGRRPKGEFDWDIDSFFVLSTGRTGTKTLAVLLDTSPEVAAYHEPHPYLSALARLAYDNRYEPMDNLVETFRASREALVRNAWACGLAYGETGPYVTLLAPVIFRALPRSRFFHLVRDPVAVVRSGLSRRWYQGNRYDARRITPRAGDPAAAAWAEWSPLEKTMWLWAETNRVVREFCGDLPEERRMVVRAEELFAGRRETVEGMFRFLGLKTPSERVVRRVLGKRLNRQPGGVPSLEEWAPDWREKLERIAGEEMAHLGYKMPG